MGASRAISRQYASVFPPERISTKMTKFRQLVVFLFCFGLVFGDDSLCIIDLECSECTPENMPIVSSQNGGAVLARAGDEVLFRCGGGKFLNYPLRDTLSTVCEAGRYRVRHDASLRHLLELGCQENVFEDVLHDVSYCNPPLQGRAYETQDETGGTRHLATVCFDPDRAIAVHIHATAATRNALRMRAHSDAKQPISLLGNFGHMFDAKIRHDAERLYGDDVSTNRRLREILKHNQITFADQNLTASKLLSPQYFDDQNMRVTDFSSNKVATWRSVANGNIHHMQRDIAKLVKMTRTKGALHIYTGTHDVMTMRSGVEKLQLFLKEGKRFPVPKYLWTVLHDRQSNRAVALAVLNDPFVAISEVRDSVFCESACSTLPWLHNLRRNRNYETPLYGLVMCCNVHEFLTKVNELPQEAFRNVPFGNDGMLTEFFA